MFKSIAIALVAMMTATAADQPVEVGKVKWGRDLDKALETSAKSGRPVLVLFQEVPG